MNGLIQNPLFLWSIGMVIVIPLLVIVIGELIERLRKRESPYAVSFEMLRNLFLPALTFALIMTVILRLGPEVIITAEGTTIVQHGFGSIIQRLAMTFLYFALAFTVLSFIAAVNVNDMDKNRWEARVPTIAKTVTRALAIILPFALTVTTIWDLDLSKFVTAIGVGSVAIAFAMQNTLASVVSGILLALDKPFKEGDWIEVNGNTGRVIDLNWRTTRIEVDGRDVVVIPNTVLLDSSLRNYTVLDIGYRDKIVFGFAYKDKPNKVKRVALQVAAESPLVAKFPPPEVHTMSYDDSSIGYEMHFHLDVFESAFQAQRNREDLMTRLYYAAAREDLEIPFPIRTLRETETGNMTDTERENIAMMALTANEHTAIAKDESLATLAQSCQIETFGKGTPISKKGDYEIGVRLLLSGYTEVRNEDGHVLGHSKPGEFCSLRQIVGRRANLYTTIASTDAECLLLPTDIVDEVMDTDPTLARALHGLADRRIERMRLNLARKKNALTQS